MSKLVTIYTYMLTPTSSSAAVALHGNDDDVTMASCEYALCCMMSTKKCIILPLGGVSRVARGYMILLERNGEVHPVVMSGISAWPQSLATGPQSSSLPTPGRGNQQNVFLCCLLLRDGPPFELGEGVVHVLGMKLKKKKKKRD